MTYRWTVSPLRYLIIYLLKNWYLLKDIKSMRNLIDNINIVPISYLFIIGDFQSNS
jgi:hypothetical protein